MSGKKAISNNNLKGKNWGKITFSFGENFKEYLRRGYSKEKLKIAIESVKLMLHVKDLRGKTFLDIGCGPGVASLAAYKMGASQITSFDVDRHCIDCTRSLMDKEKNPKNWNLHHASILDTKFLSRFPQFDYVYSFGVLHHTGDVWQAIQNSSKMVKPGGHIYFSILNEKLGIRGSRNQLKLKMFYNTSPKIVKKFIEYSLISNFYVRNWLMFKNPHSIIKNKEKDIFSRGMTFRSGIVDWLGSVPYEYAKPQAVFDFCTKKLNLQLVDMWLVDERNALGLNHFLFRKQ